MSSSAPVTSPCVGVCTLQADGYCMGCWRNLDEISHWLSFDQQQRDYLIQTELPRRQQAYFDNMR